MTINIPDKLIEEAIHYMGDDSFMIHLASCVIEIYQYEKLEDIEI